MEFKIGDKVRVVKKFEDSYKLWWHSSMDETIGRIGVVGDINYSHGNIGVNFSDASDAYQYIWYYLPEALEAAEEVSKDDKKSDSKNPKAAAGNLSLPLTMLSPYCCAVGALGKYNGMLKYGGANYIGTEVLMSVYLNAIRRHFDKILMGEVVDAVDQVPHWGAIMANIDIILSAQAAGTLIDDRLRCDGQLEAVAALQPLVASLQELHKGKDPKHYYMSEKNNGTK